MKAQFTVTHEHLKLLKHTFTVWNRCEYGAPAIDPKRPYGDSDVANSIIEILNWPKAECPHCGELLDDSIFASAKAIHKETETALQIALCTGEFKVGTYERDQHHYRVWTLVE